MRDRVCLLDANPFSGAFRAVRPVRSSPGRLRAHLPHWSGHAPDQVVAAVRRLPGVAEASANPLTGNVLVLFGPRETSADELIQAMGLLGEAPRPAELPPAWIAGRLGAAEPARTTPVAAVAPAPLPRPTGRYVTGVYRVVYQGLGWGSVGMAVVGAITPGIPTVPFVILAGYFFVRSSPESHAWLRQSRWFGPILRDWEDQRGVRRSLRNAALALVVVSMVVTAAVSIPLVLKGAVLAMQAVILVVVLRLRVVVPLPPAPLPA